jgi:hypothetical protein
MEFVAFWGVAACSVVVQQSRKSQIIVIIVNTPNITVSIISQDVFGEAYNVYEVKVKLSLCLTKHHAMEAYWELRYSSTHSLISALDGGEWLASRPGRFTPKERAPGTHWIGDWVGRSGHGVEEKNSQSFPGFETRSSDRPAPSQSLHRLSYPGY